MTVEEFITTVENRAMAFYKAGKWLNGEPFSAEEAYYKAYEEVKLEFLKIKEKRMELPIFPKAEDEKLHCEHKHYCEQCNTKYQHNFVNTVIPFVCSWKGICIKCQQNMVNQTRDQREHSI